MAKKIKRNLTFSKGCMVQAGALLLPFIGAIAGRVGSIIGTVLMLALVYIGGRMSTRWFCGNCGKPIAGKRVDRCPSCRSELSGVAPRRHVSRRFR